MLRDLYAAFNARDIDAVLERMAPDVDWPNGMEGGRMQGRDAVREYWTRQWTLMHPTVEPGEINEQDDGRVVVDVHQIIHSTSGELLSDDHITHTYVFDDGGLITRMDIG